VSLCSLPHHKYGSFDAWLGELTNIKHKVVVAGSYDTILEARLRKGPDTRAKAVFRNAHFLLGDRLQLEGWVFWGGPWSSQLPTSAGQDEVRVFTFVSYILNYVFSPLLFLHFLSLLTFICFLFLLFSSFV
jgi:hypothetical protein